MSCYLAHYNSASCKYAHQIKQTTTSYGSAALNEKGMVPKDKGWGMSNLNLWGKNPCVATLLIFHRPLLTSSNLFNVLFWVVEAVMAAGGWGQLLLLGVG